MRSIFVAAVAAVSTLLANLAFAENAHISKRPLVTVAPAPEGAAVLLVEAK